MAVSLLPCVAAGAMSLMLLTACGPQSGSVGELSGPSTTATGSAEATRESNSPPTPDPGLPSGVSAERVHKQDLVDDVVEQMWRSSDTSGYATSTVDIDALTVEIMWRGEPPADVKRLEGTTKDGVRVSIVKVPYSQNEIDAAGARVFRARFRGQTSAQVTATYANKAFDGLVVEISSARRDLTALADQLAAIAQMPVTIKPGGASVELDGAPDPQPPPAAS
jgi:hypothetical protein